MANRGAAARIKQVRSEILVVLKMVYPSALQAEVVLRSLLAIFPQLEWEDCRKDLAYLSEKGYIKRVVRPEDGSSAGQRWRERWFRLTSQGVEVADHCVADPALEV